MPFLPFESINRRLLAEKVVGMKDFSFLYMYSRIDLSAFDFISLLEPAKKKFDDWL